LPPSNCHRLYPGSGGCTAWASPSSLPSPWYPSCRTWSNTKKKRKKGEEQVRDANHCPCSSISCSFQKPGGQYFSNPRVLHSHLCDCEADSPEQQRPETPWHPPGQRRAATVRHEDDHEWHERDQWIAKHLETANAKQRSMVRFLPSLGMSVCYQHCAATSFYYTHARQELQRPQQLRVLETSLDHLEGEAHGHGGEGDTGNRCSESGPRYARPDRKHQRDASELEEARQSGGEEARRPGSAGASRLGVLGRHHHQRITERRTRYIEGARHADADTCEEGSTHAHA